VWESGALFSGLAAGASCALSDPERMRVLLAMAGGGGVVLQQLLKQSGKQRALGPAISFALANKHCSFFADKP
jgi:hypothetical protein